MKDKYVIRSDWNVVGIGSSSVAVFLFAQKRVESKLNKGKVRVKGCL